MEWHYEKDGASVGPVSEAQLQAARSDGQISGSTRVWRVGWPDWRKAGEVWPASAAPSSGTTTAVCAECHRPYPEAQLFRFDNLTICENCKPMLLDKIRQGVTPGVGPWRHGKSMVIPVNTPLPDECFKCGAPPVKSIKKVLTWHPPLVYLALLPGVLVYIIVALCVRKTATVHIPLCRDCKKSRNRKILLAWLVELLGLGLIFTGAAVSAEYPSLLGVLATTGIVLMLGALVWVLIAQTVIAKKIDKTHAWLARAGEAVLGKLPSWKV